MCKLIATILLVAAISASTNAVKSRCDFRYADWTFGGGVYTCFATVVDNSNPRTFEITNLQDHLAGKANVDVGGLFFRNQFVNELPLNIGWRFRNLRGLELDNCNITSLRSSALERLGNLIHLAMPRNRIKKIPGNFFRFTINLEWVYFHNNQLSNTGLNVLKNLRRLKGIYLANNGCVNDNAVFERRRFLQLMHSLVSKCTPEMDDFEKDLDNTECTFPEETSNEQPPKSSSSSSSEEKTKKPSSKEVTNSY